ncbi:4Fe-4S dicluster domain-containing protein, partial [Eubacterium sp. ER2]
YEILTEHNIPVWVMEPLKGGRLVHLSQEAEDILRAAAPEQSIPSWSFRYLMGLDNVQCVLSGMSSPQEVHANAEVFREGNTLSPAEHTALDRAVNAFRDSFGVPCSSCRYCCPVCPADLDIPALIQGYNELTVGGEPWKLFHLTQIKGPMACLQCGACAKRCPQRIDIPAVMKQYAALR